MPNAQTHLASACDLLSAGAVHKRFPWLTTGDARSAFLLGTIGPDVRAICGLPREATHFFEIPMHDSRPASAIMLAQWPTLKDASRLDEQQAAFVAGYMTHLVMDYVWVEKIVLPGLFIEGLPWNTEHPNWRLYSILMTYMEYQAAARLPGETVDELAQANPSGGWLPFVSDRYLADWRDHIVAMIRHGGAREVSRIFAHSNGISSHSLEEIVLSEARMAEEVYPTVPRTWLDDFQAEANRRSLETVLNYLAAAQTSSP